MQKHESGLDAPWAIGREDFECFVRNLEPPHPVVLELGSGASSVEFVRRFRDIDLVSLESSSHYLAATTALFEHEQLPRPRLLESRVFTQSWCGIPVTTYDVGVLEPDFRCDALLIDGPVDRFYPAGREAALYLLFDRCKVGAIIGLDDYHRASARRAVERWISVFGQAIEPVEETESFAVLRKVSDAASVTPGGGLAGSLVRRELLGRYRRVRARLARAFGRSATHHGG